MRKLIIIMLLTTIGNGLVGSMQEPVKEASPANLPMVKAEVKGAYKKLASKPVRAVLSSYKGNKVEPVAKSGGNIEQIVREAARKYGLDEDYFVGVAVCESTLNPTNVNYHYTAGGGHPMGLFQFLPETWSRMSSQSGIGGNVLDPVASANVAAWAWANGHSGEWECQ